METEKVLVAMSGGVDSSVAAKLLTDAGFSCIGCTMKLYDNEDAGIPKANTCCSLDDVEDARSVAYRLGMPYYVFNLKDKFAECVIDRFVNAYEHGSLKTADDYYARLSYLIDKIGYERMKHFHVHFSKIMYSAKGEIKHLNFDDKVFGPEFEPLADVLLKLNLEPVIICESAGNQDVDAKYMKDVYFAKKAALNG